MGLIASYKRCSYCPNLRTGGFAIDILMFGRPVPQLFVLALPTLPRLSTLPPTFTATSQNSRALPNVNAPGITLFVEA